MIKKHIITAFIAGILLTIFSYHAYIVYRLSTVLNAHSQLILQHEATIKEITAFLSSKK